MSEKRKVKILITGEVGSGKTTLANIIANMLYYTGIEVKLVDEPYEGMISAHENGFILLV